MKNPSAILILFWFVATSHAQAPSVVHCTVNAHASRAFAEDIGWYGPHPKRDDIRASWKQPDTTKPFKVVVPTDDTDPFDVAYGGFIFSQLDTNRPHVRLIPLEKDSDGKPVPGYERDATVMKRTPLAIFFFWEGAPDEIYSAVLHLKSRKVAIGRTASGTLVAIGVSGTTADCL